VFLFDEPLSNLDAKLRVQMRAEIKRLHQRIEATIVYVTHDQVEAMTMGDRIVVMKDGIIQQVDTPLNLYNQPANKFVAGFIGSPAMNFIDGKIIDENGLRFVSVEKSLIISLDESQKDSLISYLDKKVIAGIRPESFNTNPVFGNSVNVNIDVVEQLGNESFIHFQLDESPFIARTAANESIKHDNNFTLYLDTNAVHFFSDANTEKII
jgi:multiple sugar transport system ATP-binding protein